MLKTPTISLLHPTRRVSPSELFPRGWRDAHDAWLQRADHPENVQYVLSVHESRWEEFRENIATEDQFRLPEQWGDFVTVINGNRDCAVDNLNRAAQASLGLMLIGVQDDYYPPEHWDTLLLEARAAVREPQLAHLGYEPPPIETDEVVIVCSSGATVERDRALMISGAITRPRYERYGFILDPRFKSMFADDWYAVCARRDAADGKCQIVERLDIQFNHQHPLLGHGPADPWATIQGDDSYAQQNHTQDYFQGLATFRKLTQGTEVIALMLPGETFSHRWVAGAFEVLDYLNAKNFITERYLMHSSNVYSTRIELADAAITHKTGARPDKVLWWDDDQVVSAVHVDLLLADMEKHPEIDIIGGWSWCDTGDYENHPFRMSCGRQGPAPDLECKFFTVEDYLRMQAAGKVAITSDDVAPDALWSGFPIVLMRGSVLERLGWESFRPMLGGFRRGFTSEDTTFFYRAHQAGIKSAIDLRVKVPHLKLRAIEPPILSAGDRVAYEEFVKAVEGKLASAAD